MNHRVRNFDAGWETVKHQPADLVLQNRDQIAELVKISFRAMNRCSQMAARLRAISSTWARLEWRTIRVAGPKTSAAQRRISQE